jgi:hypothetical protein
MTNPDSVKHLPSLNDLKIKRRVMDFVWQINEIVEHGGGESHWSHVIKVKADEKRRTATFELVVNKVTATRCR